jgi:integrase
MASIAKRGESWRARIKLQDRWISKTFSKKSEASAWASQIEADISRGSAPGHKMKLSALAEIPLAKLPKRSNRRTAIELALEMVGHMPVGEIGRRHVAEMYQQVLQKPHHRTGGPVSVATANRYMQQMRAWFSEMQRDGLIEQNPFTGMRLRQEDNIRSRIITPAEMPKFLKALGSRPTQFQLLVQLALSTGARAGELLSLTWSDIDFEHNFIVLRHTKNGKPRTCGLFASVKEQLLSWRKETKLPDLNHLVIVSGDKNVTYDYKGTWLRLMAELGTEDLWFHDLRRTVGSYLAMNGASQRELQDALGHLSPSMAGRYAHLTERHVHSLVASVMGSVLKK